MKKTLLHIALFAVLSLPLQAWGDDGVRDEIAVEATAPKVTPKSHAVEISIFTPGHHEAAVYALTGQLVRQLTLEEGTTSVELTPGYYIVRIDGHSTRVVVK